MPFPKSIYWMRTTPRVFRADELHQALSQARHRPLTEHLDYGAGFVPPTNDAPSDGLLVRAAGDWLFGAMRVDTRRVPVQQREAEVLRRLAAEGAEAKPPKERLEALRQEVIRDLLPSCYPDSTLLTFALHRSNGVLGVDSSRLRDRTALQVKLGRLLGDFVPWESDCSCWLSAVVSDEITPESGFGVGANLKVRHPDSRSDIRFIEISADSRPVQDALNDGYIPYELQLDGHGLTLHVLRNGAFTKIRESGDDDSRTSDGDPFERAAAVYDLLYPLRLEIERRHGDPAAEHASTHAAIH